MKKQEADILSTLLLEPFVNQHLAVRYLALLRKYPNVPAEKVFLWTLDSYGIIVTDAIFLNMFYEMRQACFCIMLYYREKVIPNAYRVWNYSQCVW